MHSIINGIASHPGGAGLVMLLMTLARESTFFKAWLMYNNDQDNTAMKCSDHELTANTAMFIFLASCLASSILVV